MNSLKFQPLLMKAFTKKVLLEMSDKGKVIFFPPTIQLLKTYGGRDSVQTWSVVCFPQSRGRKSCSPNHGIGKRREMMETILKTETLSANAVKSNSIHKITCRQTQLCSQDLWV